MMVPNGFMPSETARKTYYDSEGRLLEVNISRGDAGRLGESNSLFQTDAEKFSTMSPFLLRNRRKDARRRNYIIQPGGAAIYFDQTGPLPEAPSHAEYPPASESFGHNSLDGTKMANAGVQFTVGIPVPREGQ